MLFRDRKDSRKSIPFVILLLINTSLFIAFYKLGESQWLLPFVSISGIFLMFKLSSLMKKIYISKSLFTVFSNCSMGVYLIHQQFLYVSGRLLNLNSIPLVLGILLNFVLALGFSMLIVSLMRKTKIGKLILGES